MTPESLGAAIQAAIESSPYDKKTVSERLDVSQNTLTSWTKGRTSPRVTELALIADLLDRPLLSFLGGDEEELSNRAGGDGAPVLPASQGIPVVSRIRAGLMSLYEVEHDASETIPVSEGLIARPGERLFGLRIEGDSMSPFLLPGDVAVCSTVRSVEVGDDVAYYRQSTGESTVKRLDALDRKTGRARLRPLNPEFETMVVQTEPGDQMALVVAIFREATRRRRTPSFQ